MKLMSLVFLIFATACAVANKYKPAAEGHWKHGYKESKLSDTSYRVTYIDPDQERAHKGFMRRSAELAQANGHKFFSVKDVGSNQETGKAKTWMMDFNMNQYQATIVFDDAKTKDNYAAQDHLSSALAQK